MATTDGTGYENKSDADGESYAPLHQQSHTEPRARRAGKGEFQRLPLVGDRLYRQLEALKKCLTGGGLLMEAATARERLPQVS